MKDLQIVWQRLVNATGTTCPRCAGTGDEVGRAHRLGELLQRFLRNTFLLLGMKKYRGTILVADIRPLPVELCRIMAFPESVQQGLE